ncbi:hypothetical protein SAMN04488539_2124 [Corynebacterium timonense]|uniref:Uncharacterized protein n=1 Tax=Corynebacterium timonense TaxID=441500 RepID=A0A1H1U224_9CORY|nr:hypothetical protein SAMN04488539_2124 [Corynebacterium timonense]
MFEIIIDSVSQLFAALVNVVKVPLGLGEQLSSTLSSRK